MRDTLPTRGASDLPRATRASAVLAIRLELLARFVLYLRWHGSCYASIVSLRGARRAVACALHLSLLSCCASISFSLCIACASISFAMPLSLSHLPCVSRSAISSIRCYRCYQSLAVLGAGVARYQTGMGTLRCMLKTSALRLMYSSRVILNKQCKYRLTHQTNT